MTSRIGKLLESINEATIKVGDIFQHHDGSIVVVTQLEDDVKNGKPGGSGVQLIGAPKDSQDAGRGRWFYSTDVVKVLPLIKPFTVGDTVDVKTKMGSYTILVQKRINDFGSLSLLQNHGKVITSSNPAFKPKDGITFKDMEVTKITKGPAWE